MDASYYGDSCKVFDTPTIASSNTVATNMNQTFPLIDYSEKRHELATNARQVTPHAVGDRESPQRRHGTILGVPEREKSTS